MKNVYAIRDNKMASFDRPVLIETDEVAVRSFGDLMLSGGDTLYSKHPSDFSIYRLGTFDDKTGKFINDECPTCLATGSDFVKAIPKGE